MEPRADPSLRRPSTATESARGADRLLLDHSVTDRVKTGRPSRGIGAVGSTKDVWVAEARHSSARRLLDLRLALEEAKRKVRAPEINQPSRGDGARVRLALSTSKRPPERLPRRGRAVVRLKAREMAVGARAQRQLRGWIGAARSAGRWTHRGHAASVARSDGGEPRGAADALGARSAWSFRTWPIASTRFLRGMRGFGGQDRRGKSWLGRWKTERPRAHLTLGFWGRRQRRLTRARGRKLITTPTSSETLSTFRPPRRGGVPRGDRRRGRRENSRGRARCSASAAKNGG